MLQRGLCLFEARRNRDLLEEEQCCELVAKTCDLPTLGEPKGEHGSGE